ncbi:MAG: tRNA pseudouridine(38-40) synthase TruA [Lentisphaeria bacterium]|jgi:tRNA pseudouridine38-40 synthase|nr:tRNA pseudouridine(38-40) synthase TruA [Lentisphaeria bacterium]MDY0175992.1 tRNA pseudouridine(38-40) synthase TruA [Lentisphaeria bacterium]NLZ59453.1 tRNA pseudouridine(38-40) synthase TruA [Lentisphaerota bacterium]
MENSELIGFHLQVAYDGGAYCGWQVQPSVKTVQGEILHRLRRMLRCPELRIYGSSRTDAGVHALDQQVSFALRLPAELSAEQLINKLNRWLPDDILITGWRLCRPDFNARYNNFGKAYIYCLAPGIKVQPLLSRYVWRTPRALDLAAMRLAAAQLCGKHDYASFAVNPGKGKEPEDTVRHVYRLEVLAQDGLVYVVVIGESFLYKMVRSLTGHLVHVGMGNRDAQETAAVLAGRDRALAAESAPAQGLFLAKVFMQENQWRGYEPSLPPFAL